MVEDCADLPLEASFFARICIAVDECVATAADGDPVRAVEVMHGLGLTKTIEALGLAVPAGEPGRRWREFRGGMLKAASNPTP